MDWTTLFTELTRGLVGLISEPGRIVMMVVGGVLIYLAIAKEYEPALLLPIGMGCILANLFGTGMGILQIKSIPWVSPPDADAEGMGLFNVLYNAGISNELFPLIIFIGIGAMTDFGPLLENPQLALMGAAGQFGIFGTLLLATLFGFDIREAASIGIIGSADGPTSIYVAAELAPKLLPPIAVAAYSYMSLVPVIQPPVIRLLTTKAAAPDPHALHLAPGVTGHAHPVPNRRHPGHQHPGPAGSAADLDADVWQPAARIAGRRAPVSRPHRTN